jgi:hypothetical protein
VTFLVASKAATCRVKQSYPDPAVSLCRLIVTATRRGTCRRGGQDDSGYFRRCVRCVAHRMLRSERGGYVIGSVASRRSLGNRTWFTCGRLIVASGRALSMPRRLP